MQFLERLGTPTPLWPTPSNPSVRFAVSAVAAVYGDAYNAAEGAGPEAVAKAVSREMRYERALAKLPDIHRAEAAAVRVRYRGRRPRWMPPRDRND
jgi:hypothetical protein